MGKMISYDFVDVDNTHMKGKAFKVTLEDEFIGTFNMYYATLREFLINTKFYEKNEKLKEMHTKFEKGMYSDELLDKNLVSWK